MEIKHQNHAHIVNTLTNKMKNGAKQKKETKITTCLFKKIAIYCNIKSQYL